MGKDLNWGIFFEDNDRFADFVNQEGFAGKEVVQAEDVCETDEGFI